MLVCYVDEAGDSGTSTARTAAGAPLMVIAGVVVPSADLHAITQAYLNHKIRFFPAALNTNHRLDAILHQIKGADLRSYVRGASRRQRTHAIGFLDGIISILQYYQAKILGRVWIKQIGVVHSDRAIYTYSLQHICATFQHLLSSCNNQGWVVADSRRKNQNMDTSHSIFTKIFSNSGNAYPNLLEMPTFGHANNHALIQIADFICSGLLFPMAAY